MPLMTNPIDAFVDALPKVELHVHLVGSISPATVAELAARTPGGPVPTDVAELRRWYVFRDFAHFVEVYHAVTALLRTAEDFRLVTYEVAGDLARQSVRYAEVTVTPYMHTVRGVPAEALVEGIEEGRRQAEADFGIRLRWCFDVPGEYGPEAGLETARIALEHRPEGLVSFGLGGPEIGVPRGQFREAFRMARDAGLRSVPHAGETTGPDTIWSAIRDLDAERIGHGTSCLSDPELVAYLRERQLPLEVCPTSNLRTRAVAELAAHPLPRMLAEGLFVTLNSDDPPMFGTSLTEEYRIAAREFGLTRAQLADLARNAVRASFLDDAGKRAILAEIDAVAGTGPR